MEPQDEPARGPAYPSSMTVAVATRPDTAPAAQCEPAPAFFAARSVLGRDEQPVLVGEHRPRTSLPAPIHLYTNSAPHASVKPKSALPATSRSAVRVKGSGVEGVRTTSSSEVKVRDGRSSVEAPGLRQADQPTRPTTGTDEQVFRSTSATSSPSANSAGRSNSAAASTSAKPVKARSLKADADKAATSTSRRVMPARLRRVGNLLEGSSLGSELAGLLGNDEVDPAGEHFVTLPPNTRILYTTQHAEYSAKAWQHTEIGKSYFDDVDVQRACQARAEIEIPDVEPWDEMAEKGRKRFFEPTTDLSDEAYRNLQRPAVLREKRQRKLERDKIVKDRNKVAERIEMLKTIDSKQFFPIIRARQAVRVGSAPVASPSLPTEPQHSYGSEGGSKGKGRIVDAARDGEPQNHSQGQGPGNPLSPVRSSIGQAPASSSASPPPSVEGIGRASGADLNQANSSTQSSAGTRARRLKGDDGTQAGSTIRATHNPALLAASLAAAAGGTRLNATMSNEAQMMYVAAEALRKELIDEATETLDKYDVAIAQAALGLELILGERDDGGDHPASGSAHHPGAKSLVVRIPRSGDRTQRLHSGSGQRSSQGPNSEAGSSAAESESADEDDEIGPRRGSRKSSSAYPLPAKTQREAAVDKTSELDGQSPEPKTMKKAVKSFSTSARAFSTSLSKRRKPAYDDDSDDEPKPKKVIKRRRTAPARSSSKVPQRPTVSAAARLDGIRRERELQLATPLDVPFRIFDDPYEDPVIDTAKASQSTQLLSAPHVPSSAQSPSRSLEAPARLPAEGAEADRVTGLEMPMEDIKPTLKNETSKVTALPDGEPTGRRLRPGSLEYVDVPPRPAFHTLLLWGCYPFTSATLGPDATEDEIRRNRGQWTDAEWDLREFGGDGSRDRTPEERMAMLRFGWNTLGRRRPAASTGADAVDGQGTTRANGPAASADHASTSTPAKEEATSSAASRVPRRYETVEPTHRHKMAPSLFELSEAYIAFTAQVEAWERFKDELPSSTETLPPKPEFDAVLREVASQIQAGRHASKGKARDRRGGPQADEEGRQIPVTASTSTNTVPTQAMEGVEATASTSTVATADPRHTSGAQASTSVAVKQEGDVPMLPKQEGVTATNLAPVWAPESLNPRERDLGHAAALPPVAGEDATLPTTPGVVDLSTRSAPTQPGTTAAEVKQEQPVPSSALWSPSKAEAGALGSSKRKTRLQRSVGTRSSSTRLRTVLAFGERPPLALLERDYPFERLAEAKFRRWGYLATVDAGDMNTSVTSARGAYVSGTTAEDDSGCGRWRALMANAREADRLWVKACREFDERRAREEADGGQ